MPAAQSKVRAIPIDQPFLRVLAKYIADKHKASLPDLSRVLIVFPAQRNKLYFRRYLLEAFNATAMIPPTMRTVDELLDEIYQAGGGRKAMILNNIERNFLLKNVVDSLKVEFWRDLSFLRFISIGDRLLDFFDELVKEQVTLDMIEKTVAAGHYPERYVLNELPILRKIYETYRRRLEHGHGDVIDKYTSICEHFNPEQFHSFSSIIIAGLVAPTAVAQQVISKMLKDLPAELILHFDHKAITRNVNPDHPFYSHFRLVHALGVQKVARIGSSATPELARIHTRRLESVSQQAFYLKECLASALQYYKPNRIAVILTDESIVHTITETLKTAGVDYNLSAGLQLSQSILFSFLKLLKDVCTSNGHCAELFSFIRHPLVKNAVVNGKPLRALIYRLEEVMIERRINYFRKNDFDSEFTELVEFITDCMRVVREKDTLIDYLHGLIELLNRVLGYNRDFMTLKRQDVTSLLDELAKLARLRIAQQSKGLDMLDFVLTLIRNVRFPAYGEPLKGVQIIGLLEARNLDFDCVIMPSMNEGVFPKQSEKDLFVNQAVRKEVGLPYDKERENLFYFYFTELTNGKKDVYLSYVEEEHRDVRSRFIDFLVEQGRTTIDEKQVVLESAAIKHGKRTVKKDPHVFSYLRTMVSGKGLSPTHLKDYRECPYRFYLKYVLRMKEPEQIIEEPGALEWGSALHQALQYLYKYDVPHGYVEIDIPRVQELLEKRLTAAVRSEVARIPKKVMQFDFELIKRRMGLFFENEVRRFGEGFHVLTEKLEERTKGGLSLGDIPVHFFGFPDRIDEKDGKYYVLDYKSKAPARKFWTIGSEFREFQLPLYALMLSNRDYKKIGGIGYYDLTKKLDIVFVADRDDVVDYLKEFEKQMLIPTLKDLLDPKVSFSQTADPDACRYCSFMQMCGIQNV